MKRRSPREVPSVGEIEQSISRGLDLNSKADNYLRWISDLCVPFVGHRILEVGAGNGDFTDVFRKFGFVTATEIAAGSLETLSRRFREDSSVTIATDDLLSPSASKYDTVVLINVLEHLRDDELALKGIYERLESGGHVLLYVPAFWMLYSRFDNKIGHFRRYRRTEVAKIARDAGFEHVESRYVNMIGAVGWFVVCRILRRSASETATVGLMNALIVPAMRFIEDRVKPPFGVSVFYVGRRP